MGNQGSSVTGGNYEFIMYKGECHMSTIMISYGTHVFTKFKGYYGRKNVRTARESINRPMSNFPNGST